MQDQDLAIFKHLIGVFQDGIELHAVAGGKLVVLVRQRDAHAALQHPA